MAKIHRSDDPYAVQRQRTAALPKVEADTPVRTHRASKRRRTRRAQRRRAGCAAKTGHAAAQKRQSAQDQAQGQPCL